MKMTFELQMKLKIAQQIQAALIKTGIFSAVTLLAMDDCMSLYVNFEDSCIEDVSINDKTCEQELLDWLSAIERS